MDILKRNLKELDFTLIGTVLALGAFGCLAVLAATYGKSGANMPSHPVAKQILWQTVGFVVMWFVVAYDYRSLRKWRWWLYGFSILLLLAVFARPAIQGAHAWLDFGPVSLQPSEFAKLTMIIAIAGHMANVDEQEFPDYGLRNTWQVFVLFAIPFVLTLKEPALGQALVMFAIAGTMYTVFARRSHFVVIIATIVVVVAGLVVVATQFPDKAQQFVNGVLVKHHLLKPFQADRIVTWLDPQYDPLNTGYNVRQAQIAVGSGQIFGEGLFNGIETRGGWVPNQWNDYIFTAIAEEFGFVGSSLLIFLFLVFLHRLVRIARTAQDTFGTYLVMGMVGMFAFQVFENIGMDMYLSPSTGITLPFISYGGSSVVANYVMVGLALSVSLRRRKLRFD
ncbi:FtsW/RodA/SpoVE family cell cycle protein [Alicyclobacillus macrosporangiidus]|uniref:Rod shape determining protein RodA n=1 Tax=Alicyclobacillus macrosporangiidus TaxID=392015 RepID=A0A1I7FRB2_9BACL|nr:FtsW/RodA/SpoVE family cell cycle protein [Alicyclobacillus macrosporangiidus]SFU38681.1 rod shape determining protein RodA [Alicyclobacillus macrosporangiidus]